MVRVVRAEISKNLYDIIIKEKNKLLNKEKNKRGKKKRITMIHASLSLCKRLR